jgi:hypothetical protein
MTRTGTGSLVALALLVAVGCNKEGGDAAQGASAKPAGASTAASNLPVKGPWEAIKITMVKKDPDGTTHFKVDNVGSKTVTQIYIDKYGYDAKGKQVVHTDLGFSLPIKGGASDDFTQGPVKDVETWEAVYHGIRFEGDAKDTMDYKRAPAQRVKGAS